MNSSTSRKEVKQMPAKAKTPNELAVIVRENLKRLTANTRYPKATIADVCHVTRGTVSHWFSETKPKLPSMECLIKIADYIIDLGPEGGDMGGNIVACGTPREVAKNPSSYTGQYLKQFFQK